MYLFIAIMGWVLDLYDWPRRAAKTGSVNALLDNKPDSDLVMLAIEKCMNSTNDRMSGAFDWPRLATISFLIGSTSFLVFLISW